MRNNPGQLNFRFRFNISFTHVPAKVLTPEGPETGIRRADVPAARRAALRGQVPAYRTSTTRSNLAINSHFGLVILGRTDQSGVYAGTCGVPEVGPGSLTSGDLRSA